MSTQANYVAMTTSGTPGTGTITLGAALAAPDRSFFAAYGAGSWGVDVEYYDSAGVALGVERDLVYNGANPGTLTRGTAETPASLLSLAAGGSVRVVMTANLGNRLETVVTAVSGGVLGATATGVAAWSAALAAGELVRGGGAGAVPSTAGAATVTGTLSISGAVLSGAANVLSQVNSTTAQTFRVYNTYTNASNGEWTDLTWSSNVAVVSSNNNGTGVQRNIHIRAANQQLWGGSHYWATANGTVCIGVVPVSNGIISFVDSSGSDVNRLQLGGSTASFPAIGRSGTSLVLQLADGTLQVPLTPAAAATLQLGVAASATPVAQTLQAQGSRGGTDSNVGGANITLQSGAGTGTGTRSTLILRSPLLAASGTTQQTQTTGLTISNGCARLTPYTVATLPGTPTQGDECHVTDATAPVWNTALVGGGAVFCGARYNGTAWVAF